MEPRTNGKTARYLRSRRRSHRRLDATRLLSLPRRTRRRETPNATEPIRETIRDAHPHMGAQHAATARSSRVSMMSNAVLYNPAVTVSVTIQGRSAFIFAAAPSPKRTSKHALQSPRCPRLACTRRGAVVLLFAHCPLHSPSPSLRCPHGRVHEVHEDA